MGKRQFGNKRGGSGGGGGKKDGKRKRQKVSALEARLREQGVAVASAATKGRSGYVDPEDEEIARLERKLGWTGKSASEDSISKELAEEGFGDDFGQFLSILDGLADREKSSVGETALRYADPEYHFQTVSAAGSVKGPGVQKKMSLSERAMAASLSGKSKNTASEKVVTEGKTEEENEPDSDSDSDDELRLGEVFGMNEDDSDEGKEGEMEEEDGGGLWN